YIAETLETIIDGHPHSRIEDLMPWRFRQNVKPASIGLRLSAYQNGGNRRFLRSARALRSPTQLRMAPVDALERLPITIPLVPRQIFPEIEPIDTLLA
ncbi:hypothetical protein, partial [Bradyrhizobium sp. SSUT77]|uniref:hypothetical protein n=1 Tax=Bradyrhizobium sp. SSUT77 TaxID=3040603 RepID=UPI00244D0425